MTRRSSEAFRFYLIILFFLLAALFKSFARR